MSVGIIFGEKEPSPAELLCGYFSIRNLNTFNACIVDASEENLGGSIFCIARVVASIAARRCFIEIPLSNSIVALCQKLKLSRSFLIFFIHKIKQFARFVFILAPPIEIVSLITTAFEPFFNAVTNT